MRALFAFLLFTALTHTSFAAITEIKEGELLALTGLDVQTVSRQTEKSLEEHLFQDENSFVCGLQEFRIEYYQTNDDLLKSALQNFSVVTEVFGPIGTCRGYEYFLCSTDWSKVNNSWEVKGTTCENDNDFGPILTHLSL